MTTADGHFKGKVLTEQRCPQCGQVYPAHAARCADDGTFLPHWSNLVGQTVADRYIIEDLVAVGGMAVVYLARQKVVNRMVALKVLRAPESIFDHTHFMSEARVISRLRHPNIVTLFDFGQLEDGRLFMALEYIDGQSLSTRLAQGPLPLADALQIGQSLCSALEEAHRLGVVHRDVKPDNVMIEWNTDQWSVRLVDFGIADQNISEASDQLRLGTPEYASPETLTGLPIDYRSDLYALGLILFEMVTGQRPFPGQGNVVAQYHASTRAPLPSSVMAQSSLLPQLDHLIGQLLSKNPDERPASAGEVARRLQECEAATHSPDEAATSNGREPSSAKTQTSSIGSRPGPRLGPSGHTQNPAPTSDIISVKAPLPRWKYIVTLGLVSASAMGIVYLQNATESLETHSRKRRTSVNFGVYTQPHSTEVYKTIAIDQGVQNGIFGPLIPSAIPQQLKTGSTTKIWPAPTVKDSVSDTSILSHSLPEIDQKLRELDEADNQWTQLMLVKASLQWREANSQFKKAQVRFENETKNWRKGGQTRLPEIPVLRYDEAVTSLLHLLRVAPKTSFTHTLLNYAAHGLRLSSQTRAASTLERRLLTEFPDHNGANDVRIRLADEYFRTQKHDLARTEYVRLGDTKNSNIRLYSRFMLVFVDYAQKHYAGALDRGLSVYETLRDLEDSQVKDLYGIELLRLIVMAAAHVPNHSTSIRGYLKGLGGPLLEENYLPLLAFTLDALGHSHAVVQHYEDLANISLRASELAEFGRWTLLAAQNLEWSSRINEALSMYDDELNACQVLETAPKLHGECLVGYGRCLQSIGALLDAQTVFRKALKLSEYRTQTSEGTSPNWVYEAQIRAIDTQDRADESERMERYRYFLDTAPSHWQAVAYSRIAQLHEQKAFDSRNRSERAAFEDLAKALYQRSGIRFNSSKYGMDWWGRYATP